MSIRARRAGRLARCAAAVAVAGVAAAGGAIPAAAATSTGDAPVVHPPDRAVFALRDPRIGESSGLAVASRERGVYFTHNDSGDSARFFAVDSTGRTLVTFDVRGASAVDWEDMATAPGPDGTPSVWLADIGDNGANHQSVTVYVVAEPRVARGSDSGTRTLPVTATYRLRYPDRPHDAETLLVDPVRRRAFIVTKSMTGRSDVYALPARPTGASVATLRHVGSLAFGVTGSAGGPLGPLGALPATGGDVAPRGRLLAIRTYTDVYVWRLRGGPVSLALQKPPAWRIPGPPQPQGEGIAFTADGRRLLLSSEGASSRVYEIVLPRARGTGGSSAVSVGVRAGDPSDGVPTVAIGLGIVAALAAGVTATGLVMRRRRRTG